MRRLHSAIGQTMSLGFSAWLLAACIAAPLAHAEAFKLRVVDDQGQGVQRFQVYVQNEPRNAWIPGVEGFTVLEVNPQIASSIRVVSLAVRADGYASACAQYRGKELEKLLDGKAVVTLSKGAQVELKLQLPEGIVLPNDFVPDIYFDSWAARVRSLRPMISLTRARSPVELKLQLFEGVSLPIDFPPDVDFDSWASYVQTIRPMVSVTRALSPLVDSRAAADRAESSPATFKMHPSDSRNYSFRLAPNTERIWVGIHCPGVLQYFDAGPFTFADVKDGVLTVDVPKPAALDLNTDLGLDDSGLRKIRSYSLSVHMLTPGGQRRLVASEYSPLPLKAVHLVGLAAATYTVSFRTTPNVPETGLAADDAPNPGRYNFEQEVKLQPGKTEQVEIRYVPPDPNAFHANSNPLPSFTTTRQ
jgi:hypothetical protein